MLSWFGYLSGSQKGWDMNEVPVRQSSLKSRMRWEDGVVYALILAGIYLFGVLIGLVLLMPPYRQANWISGRGGRP